MRRCLIAACTALAVSALPVMAEPLPAADGPSFKRVRPPAAGVTRRITIQIEPAAPEKAILPNVPNLPAPAPALIERKVVTTPGFAPAADAARHAGWFWSDVPARIDRLGEVKFPLAMKVLLDHPAEAARMTPRMDRIESIAATYGAAIAAATEGTRVSPALVVALISVESAGKPDAESHAGAVGLMQLMPATAKRFGVTDRTDPAQSIRGGVAYLDWLIDHFNDDAVLALAAYNAGEGAVRGKGGVPNYRETRNYVPKVVAAWSQARKRCLVPPVRATDACLFGGVQIAQQ